MLENKKENFFLSTGNEVPIDKYNLIMGGTILYGLIIDALICILVPNAWQITNSFAFIIIYFLSCILGSIITYKSDNPLISFLGYNLIIFPLGLIVSEVVNAYGGISSSIVGLAFMITAIIVGVMMILSTRFPKFFSNLGGPLFGTLIGLLVAGLFGMIFGMSNIFYSVYCYIGAGLFSLYIGYDFYRANCSSYPKTIRNAICDAANIYIDIVNLFIRILQIIGRSSSKND